METEKPVSFRKESGTRFLVKPSDVVGVHECETPMTVTKTVKHRTGDSSEQTFRHPLTSIEYMSGGERRVDKVRLSYAYTVKRLGMS